MKKSPFLVLLLFLSPVCFAQLSGFLPSSTAIANTGTARSDGNWNAFSNPATLAFVAHPMVAMQFENRYLLKELSTKSIHAGFPSKLLSTGMSFSYSGYALYNEMLAGLSFARNFGNKFSLGLGFDYQRVYFSASNNYHSALVTQLGVLTRLSSHFSLAFHAYNPFQSVLRTDLSTQRIPSVFSLGTEYFFAPEFLWRVQADREVGSNYRFATGFEYRMMQQIVLKAGAYGSAYLVPCMGLGWQSGRITFDVNGEIHPLLGLTTLAAIRYQFGKL